MNTETRLRLAKELLALIESQDEQDLNDQLLARRLKLEIVIDKVRTQDYLDAGKDSESIQFIY